MPRTFKKNRDLSIEDGEKESMLDNEDTNNDDRDRDREDREERMARPKRDFNRKRDKRDKMDRSAKSTAGRLDENDHDDGGRDAPGGAVEPEGEEDQTRGGIWGGDGLCRELHERFFMLYWAPGQPVGAQSLTGS